MSDNVVIYPGSFDPITFGHVNIIERGLLIFDHIILVVAANSSKQSILSLEERLDLLKELFAGNDHISVDGFSDRLLIDYAKSRNVHVIMRGLRTVSDYEYEFQMAHANRKLAPEIDTIFMMTESGYSHLSSTLIKEIIRYGGSCKEMLDPRVEKRFRAKMRGKQS